MGDAVLHRVSSEKPGHSDHLSPRAQAVRGGLQILLERPPFLEAGVRTPSPAERCPRAAARHAWLLAGPIRHGSRLTAMYPRIPSINTPKTIAHIESTTRLPRAAAMAPNTLPTSANAFAIPTAKISEDLERRELRTFRFHLLTSMSVQ